MMRFSGLFGRTILVCFIATVLFKATTSTAQENCPHGQTATDIATLSGTDLTGKVALVTGGRSGLGYAISEALLSRGCTVVLASRNETLNAQAVMDLKKNSNEDAADVSYMTFDLESFESIRSLASDFEEKYSRLDYYFGNAGQGNFGAQPLTVDGYEKIFQVNYVGQVLLVELLLPLMRKSQPSRIILTASNSNSQACDTLGLGAECWGDGTALSTLPYDQAGLEAVNYTFGCGPLFGTYPITKFLMIQLAQSISKQEMALGNEVYAYSFAPGNIRTALNSWAVCCFGAPGDDAAAVAAATLSSDTTSGADSPPMNCPFSLPYVGPKDADGNPDPPNPPDANSPWVSPAHGTMAAIYSALLASPADAGAFYATYWECEVNKGYFPQGITPQVSDQIYQLSKSWTGMEKTANAEVMATSGGGSRDFYWLMSVTVVLIGKLLL